MVGHIYSILYMYVNVYVYKTHVHVFPGMEEEDCTKDDQCYPPLICIIGVCGCRANETFIKGVDLLLPFFNCIPRNGTFSFANLVI